MACGRKELLVLGGNGLLRLEALCKNHGMSLVRNLEFIREQWVNIEDIKQRRDKF